MKLQTLALGAAFLLAGCSPGRHPITEELSFDQINKLVGKDPAYQTVIMFAESFRQHASTLEMAKASELSYDRLYKFMDSYYDADVRYRLRTEAEKQWTDQGYAAQYTQADSLIRYWQQYLDEHKPDSYVKVELAAILPAESRYGTANVLLDITPLKGPVDKVEGSFGIFVKDSPVVFGDFSPARHNQFTLENGLRSRVRIEGWMNYSIWGITDGDIAYNMYPDRPGLSIRELLEKYTFDYSVTTLVKDGQPIRYADVYQAVPGTIRNYWSAKEEDRIEQEEHYYSEIIRELVDPAFISRSDFTEDSMERYYRDLDPLAAWLMMDRYQS